MEWLEAKIREFRRRAADYERDGLTVPSRIYTNVADELEAGLVEHGSEELTITEAARESGYDPSAISKMRKAGRLPTGPAGGILRRDLPRKPGRATAVSLPPAQQLAAEILADIRGSRER